MQNKKEAGKPALFMASNLYPLRQNLVMQHVISVNIMSQYSSKNGFIEYKFPELEKYLDDQWKIVNVYQTAFPIEAGTTGVINLTFVVQKGS